LAAVSEPSVPTAIVEIMARSIRAPAARINPRRRLRGPLRLRGALGSEHHRHVGWRTR
jgi:hypothetical protein